jgi:ABC-type uncharacterized transport system substrate-binding protein
MGIMTKPLLLLLALASSLLPAFAARAHPHVWVTMQTELLYAPDGSMKAVRHIWSFDDMFSAFATQGIVPKKKGAFTREELKPLAQVNVHSLKEFDYFTFAKANGRNLDFDSPLADYFNDYKNSALTLHFTLPLKAPVKAKEIAVEIYDASFFVDFSFADKNPARLVGAPAACKVSVQLPAEMDMGLAMRLSQLPADVRVDPSLLLGSQFANKVMAKCP